jgi:glycosyltransferase involved in cell wall biosynthesis
MRERAEQAGISDRVRFLNDVGDEEKISLMAGSAAYLLPSKPRAEFVETFGIALVEKMLAGGGPVITTATGGIPEAVGDTAVLIPAGAPEALAEALDQVVLRLDPAERDARADKARAYALQFDRLVVFDRLFERVLEPDEPLTLS